MECDAEIPHCLALGVAVSMFAYASACYVDESFVGVIAKICKSSTNGVKLDRAATAVFAK